MSAIAIQSDQKLIDSLTELRNVINEPKTSKAYKINGLRAMNSLLTKISNEQHSSVVIYFALDIVNKYIANLQRQNTSIPSDLETKRAKLSSNLIRSTQRETLAAAAAAAAAATNAARCTGRGCFSRFFSSRVTPMPTTSTSPIISPYNPQPAIKPFRRTSKSHEQTTPPSLPGAVEDRMPLGGSRRVRRRTKHGQRVKHRRRTVRRLF